VLTFQVGCAYIGTVVGAGFASGQEIYQFFGRYGNLGYLALALSVFLFAWLGYRIMALGHYLKAYSYRELNAHMFGKKVGQVFDYVLIVMLFGVSVAMLAGAGALFKERLHVSFQIGALFTLVVTFLTLVRGMKGIFSANTLIVPVMVCCVVYTAAHVVYTHSWADIWNKGMSITPHKPVLALLSGVIYAAFNIGLAAGVLIPIGASIEDMAVLRRGAAIGAAGLGIMLMAVLFTLFANYPEAMDFAIPMAYVTSRIGSVLQWLFLFVLWGEIYSTLVGNVYSVGAQLGARSDRQMAKVSLFVLVAAYLCSQVGFPAMVKYVYGVFGWISMLIVLAIAWPREKLSILR
jgi:uncharacterized membrane protein YkvI